MVTGRPVASYPGSLGAEEKEPGIYCVHMRVIAPTFHGLRTLSVHVRSTMTSLQGLEKMERPIAYALRRVGYPSMTLEPEQKDCVQCVYEGKDVFVWLPTGFGKTVCFEVLPFMFDMKLGRVDSLVVVASPLASLMIDQVRSLRSGSDRVWRDTDGCTALLGAGPWSATGSHSSHGLSRSATDLSSVSTRRLHLSQMCWGKPSFTATLYT